MTREVNLDQHPVLGVRKALPLRTRGEVIPQIQVVAPEGIDKEFLTRVRGWAGEVIGKAEAARVHPNLCVTIWRTMEKFQAFCREEKESLGVITGEEMDFLATHDAWRGYPRIHICQERIKGISGPIIQGVIHHEIAHALHHGTPEFYTFRFSKRLQAAGGSHGLDFSRLQQCVYFLSVAIKDREVVEWLARVGLGFSQMALLEYLVSDTEEERRAWDAVCDFPTLRKIALAAFLKTFLPIEAMIAIGMEGAKALRIRWDKAYEWLSERDRGALSRLARYTMTCEGGAFQDRLENAVLHLFTYS